MKILFLLNHLNTGGITSYILTLSKGLVRLGHSVSIASSGGELLYKFRKEGIIHYNVPLKTKNEISPKIIISALILLKVIQENKFDIVHSQSRTTQVLGCLLSKLTGVRHIFTCHGFFKRRLSRRLMPCWGEKVIAISSQVEEHLVRDFNLSLERIFLVCNGIDTNRFSPVLKEIKDKAKQILGLKPNTVVGILARLSSVKGHRYLIEAMKDVVLSFHGVQLLIAGEGKIKKELEELVSSLGIKESVFFIPKSTDTKDILSAIDIFVLPSLEEGLGLALMEAMSMGLAVIGSRVGGIKTLIKDGLNGLLVKPKDPKGISCAIIDLITNPDKALRLGLQAREGIVKDFSCLDMVKNTEAVYLEVLKDSTRI